MPDCCPACDERLNESERQRFCTNCGEPINVDPDRERIRRQARGFLGDERKKLIDTINGERDHQSEYTIMHVQERTRQALFDFGLVDGWTALENSDLLFHDVEDTPDEEEGEYGEFAQQLISSLSLMSILHANLGTDLMAALLEVAVSADDSLDEDADVEVEVRVDGEQVNKPLDELVDSFS